MRNRRERGWRLVWKPCTVHTEPHPLASRIISSPFCVCPHKISGSRVDSLAVSPGGCLFRVLFCFVALEFEPRISCLEQRFYCWAPQPVDPAPDWKPKGEESLRGGNSLRELKGLGGVGPGESSQKERMYIIAIIAL